MSESIVVGLFTFFLGLLLGHRMSLWRERRKEFNEVAVKIRVALKSRRDRPSTRFSKASEIESKDMEVFVHSLSSWKKARFQRTWNAYESECTRTKQDALGQTSYEDSEAVAAALDRAIPYTTLR